MRPEDLRGVYKEIAIRINIETAVKIHKLLKGQQINFPKNIYSTSYIHSSIKAEFNGCNIQELSIKYGISKRRVRQILYNK